MILLRRRSAWVDGALCAWIVRRLAHALGHYMPTHQPILFLYALRAHVTNGVFAACAEVQIWPVVVPARMTWLLQPADTHAFLAYKICLQQLCHAARVRAADGDLTLADLRPCSAPSVACLNSVSGAVPSIGTGTAWRRMACPSVS